MVRGRNTEQEPYWRGVLGDQLSSGLSITAFCREREVSAASFFSWRRKLADRDRGVAHESAVEREDTAAKFVPIELPSPPAATKLEGDSGTTAFTFLVSRSGDIGSTSSVDWTVGGGTANAVDFAGGVFAGGTLQFAAGETSKTITVHVQGDTVGEADEDFTVSLSNASVGTLIATGSAAGNILNE